MNEIDLREARQQIGDESWARLEQLKTHYHDDFREVARLAQSIITRSEIALFGVSIPRFAVRLYLKRGGFLNCRRLAVLCEMFLTDDSKEWGERDETIEPCERNASLSNEQQDNRTIEEVVSSESCIADSLLPPPRKLSTLGIKNIRFVDMSRARLPEAYGEKFSSQNNGNANSEEKALSIEANAYTRAPLLPYTQTMNLGGGLCTQAVSFMTTAILAHLSGAVHGIAEITAMAHEPACKELSLGGLDPDSMRRYFEKVNLNLAEQSASKIPKKDLVRGSRQDVGLAINCYLRSGMPVILPTNLRMLGFNTTAKTVYENNRVRLDGVPPDEDHVVLIVGAGVIETNKCFIFQDSATLPYMYATLDEVCEIGAGRHNGVPDNGVIMPVVPKAVKMPLLDERIYERDEADAQKVRIEGLRIGLNLISSMFHFASDDPCPAQPSFASDRFQLICTDTFTINRQRTTDDDTDRLYEEALHFAIRSLTERRGWQKPHWLWLEIYPHSLWIWDAEAEPLENLPSTRSELLSLIPNKYLLGTIQLEGTEGVVTFFTSDAPEAN